MNRFMIGVCLMLWSVASPVLAAEIPVADNLVFSLAIEKGWTLHLSDPPEALVEETASHIAHEPAAANATQEQILRVARNRLLANEAIVYHSDSGAHIDIDFSPLEEGESAPTSETLEKSAEYASQSLSGEEDVKDVKWDVSSANISGAREVYLLSANYLQHDLQMEFRGYIGFASDAWFFIYFTAPGNSPGLLNELERMLRDSSIRVLD